MTTTRSDGALQDEAVLVLRRAAVTTFMRLGDGFQRATLAEATDDPRVLERLKLIAQPAMQDDGCACGAG
jgi:hypothetical protein